MTADRNRMTVAGRAWLILVACVLLPVKSHGGGTVDLADVDPLLRQAPAVRSALVSSLDLANTATAAVRFGPQFTHLGGARMGPYIIRARPKGSTGGDTLEVVVCTRARLLDASGKATESASDAVRVEEHVTVVMLRVLNAVPAIPTCPEG